MILGGLLSVLVGALLFVFPAEGAVILVWPMGIYAIIAGLIELLFAFCVWSLWNNLKTAGIVGG